jgi:catechol 2,3-dioxygenase-like lactoylglutathione lyase family enzyme
MAKPDIAGIAPFFIVRNVPAALAFYRDRLGFDITFQGPDPDDIFFGIVQRGGATIMLRDVGVEPLPNCKRDGEKGWARWDAYLAVPDPDALAAEFASLVLRPSAVVSARRASSNFRVCDGAPVSVSDGPGCRRWPFHTVRPRRATQNSTRCRPYI